MSVRVCLAVSAFAAAAGLAAAAPRVEDPPDVAPFGAAVVGPDGSLGIEWDAPRIVARVELALASGSPAPDLGKLAVSYWHKSWDGKAVPESGWARIDDPLTGRWRVAQGSWEWGDRGERLAFAFSPALSKEIEGAPDGVPFRKTYKLRIALGDGAPRVLAVRALSPGRWAECALAISALPSFPAGGELAVASVHNGHVLAFEPLRPGKAAVLRLLRLDVSKAAGGSNPRDERALVTLATPAGKVTFAVDDALAAPLPIPDFGVEVRAAGATGAPPAEGKRVLDALRDEPEQTWSRARREVIAPLKTLQRGEVRYTPLSWDSHRHKFKVYHDGSIAMDLAGGKLWETSAEKLGWPGDELAFSFPVGRDRWEHAGEHENDQELESGYLPLVRTRWDHEGVRYDQQAFATLLGPKPGFEAVKGDEPAALFVRIRATNLRMGPNEAWLWIVPEAPEELALLGGGEAGAAVLAAGSGREVRAHLRSRAGTLEIAAADDGAKPARAVLWRADLRALRTEILDVVVPFGRAAAEALAKLEPPAAYDRERALALAYWTDFLDAQGSSVRVPEPAIVDFLRANRAHIAISVQRDLATGFDMVPAATFHYQVCMNEACYQILAMDVQGLHARAARYLEPFLKLQGTDPLDGGFRSKEGVFHGLPVPGHNYQGFRYNLDHGFVLWTLGEHYLLSRDRAWMDANADRIVAGCEFVARERRAEAAAPGGDREGIRGLVPPGHLEDVAEWHRWFAVNAYFHLGMKRAGQALAAHGHPRAAEILGEAEAYRKDIERAAAFARERAPVTRLRDGTAVPLTPTRVDLRGRELGWIREQLYGSIHLLLGEVIEPTSREAGWILDDFEDNLFLRPEFGRPADLPEYWFSHGGHAVQSNLVPVIRAHLYRGDHRAAVRTLLNNLATNLFEDVRQSTEHPVEHFGHGRGPFYKSSDEGSWVVSMRNALAFEKDPETLWLLPAAPRAWFGPGQVISVRDVATWFGPCSVLVEGGKDSIRATVRLPSRSPPRRAVLFLRHAEERPLREVRSAEGGGAARTFPVAEPAEGGVDLSGLTGEVRLEALY